MLDWIIRYWVQWLFGLICAALLAGYRRLAKRVKEQEEERKAIKAGLLAILHDRLYAECSPLPCAGQHRHGRHEESGIPLPQLPCPGRQRHRYRAVQPRQGPADQKRLNTYTTNT